MRSAAAIVAGDYGEGRRQSANATQSMPVRSASPTKSFSSCVTVQNPFPKLPNKRNMKAKRISRKESTQIEVSCDACHKKFKRYPSQMHALNFCSNSCRRNVGAHPYTFKDLTGEHFGRWTVIGLQTRDRNKQRRKWICRCSCESQTSGVVSERTLLRGQSRSCGCISREWMAVLARKAVKHGYGSHPLYGLYAQMHKRCYRETEDSYANYGGRGIGVEERWRSPMVDGPFRFDPQAFRNFLADVGERPSPKHELDRLNNDASYGPTNFRWATRSVQMANKRPQKAIENYTEEEVQARVLPELTRRGYVVLPNVSLADPVFGGCNGGVLGVAIPFRADLSLCNPN